MKKYTFYFVLGVLSGLFIMPWVVHWLGLPSPSRGIANLLSVVFGEPGGFSSVLTILVSGVFIVLMWLAAIKLAKKLEKSA
ncbi:hypothetical protein AB1K89_12285 [Sporosarcina sp. 179-K 8C2 HS]|uniref:hypothetical protein n=1 Tax=Sporosarcina sp. 179-K 8C2 HS TaxID=3142387 RepID=UPI0039A29BE8